jgi:hypothetical protein
MALINNTGQNVCIVGILPMSQQKGDDGVTCSALEQASQVQVDPQQISNTIRVVSPNVEVASRKGSSQKNNTLSISTAKSTQRSSTSNKILGKRKQQGNVPKREPSKKEGNKRGHLRPYQEEQWKISFKEVIAFKEKYGHCCIPHDYEASPALCRWVKRQRYQYKLKKEGKVSALNESRKIQLQDIGFVWDSHAASWLERLTELKQYLKDHGNCNVPARYSKKQKLATWVKCQRRQYKLFKSGQQSNITKERVKVLDELGFTWEIRNVGKGALPKQK